MSYRLTQIIEGINSVENVAITRDFEITDTVINGGIAITEKEVKLNFDVTIYPPYPFQFHEMETIRFCNKELIEYDHVNKDGSICVHTPHNSNLKNKIFYDLGSLKQWMLQYYINKETDQPYHHIVVSESTTLTNKFCYLFTDINYDFKKGEYGSFRNSFLSKGMHRNDVIFTYLVQGFNVKGKQHIPCEWSSSYKKLSYQEGLYIFLEYPPVFFKRFIVDRWVDIEPFISQDFLKFIDGIKRNNNFNKKGISELPLFIGYKIPTGEVHWQCAIIDVKAFPNYAIKLDKNNFVGRLHDQKINWVQTKNNSYQYFFGRGGLNKEITEKKILIIGIGAVGSIVATTLTRGGCKSLSLVDHDIKEPENVCRSEYKFNTGLNSKVNDLSRILGEISPFVEVSAFPEFMEVVKTFINANKHNNEIKSIIDKYDLIIDCTADNDVAYILNLLQVKAPIINLSITNYARELVCVVKPNLYYWLQEIFKTLRQDEADLYQPSGCWNPTFKASYNDINVMVQYAIKHINLLYETGRSLRNFYIAYDNTNGFTIKLNQF